MRVPNLPAEFCGRLRRPVIDGSLPWIGRVGYFILLLLLPVSAAKKPAGSPDKLDTKAMLELARLGRGFLVWERYQDGSWQIWSKQLDGTGEQRLVPAEPGHDHFCPKISPDGARMAYLSYPTGSNAYPLSPKETGALWLMNLRKNTLQLLAPEARSYKEDRAVTWRDDKTLCYIGSAGETLELSLDNPVPRKVIDHHGDHFGYLPNPNLTFATTGMPEFAPLLADGRIVHQETLGGCQPYFTQDSLWGYWMDGPGGPIGAVFLPTRRVHHIFNAKDKSLPQERNYIYFPMISPCMRLLAFGASTGQHNHFEADYNIFLAPIHPGSLKLLGRPVRYTNSEGCDRFPDVFRRELALGTHFIETSEKVLFEPEGGRAMCDFDFGDGTKAHARTAEHVYLNPGDYRVTASFGKDKNRRSIRGFVHVDPSSAPELVGTERENERTLLVKFDRRVDAGDATATIGNGPIPQPESTMAGHALRLQLPPGLVPNAELRLEGVRSASGEKKTMAPATIPAFAASWPVAKQGLAFAWQDAFARETAGASTGGMLLPRGLAFWNECGAMKSRGGSFEDSESGKRISQVIAKSNAFSVEAVLTAETFGGTKDNAVIVALSGSEAAPNLVIRQRAKWLSLDLLCRGAGPGSTKSINNVFVIEPGEPHHYVLTYADGKIGAFYDGVQREIKETSIGRLADWKPQPLRFAAAADGSKPWHGLIERVAFYDRVLTPQEIASHAASWKTIANSRVLPSEWKVVGRLVESTHPPGLTDIQPYKEALVRQLFEVEKNFAGDGKLPKQITVTQWAWLGGTAMPAQSLKAGDKVRLTIQESEAHPELRQLVIKDDLTQGFEVRQFHDVGDWDNPIRKE